jgi:hypothetical protein
MNFRFWTSTRGKRRFFIPKITKAKSGLCKGEERGEKEKIIRRGERRHGKEAREQRENFMWRNNCLHGAKSFLRS